MAKLPALVETPTVSRIFAAYEKVRAEQPRREHLGVSTIGKPCTRATWYDWRWAGIEQHEGRMLRLFDTGTLEESRLVADLRRVGVTVWEVDEGTGRQWWFSDPTTGGHISGSCDGIALGFEESKAPHFLEFKTHSVKSFAKLKKGLKEGHGQHWAQCQGYMHLSGLRWGAANRIDRTYYLAVCKDTDEIYGERVRYDETAAQMLFDRAASIVRATEPPARISDDPEYFACTYCAHADHCHGKRTPKTSCRTCVHATPVTDRLGAVWACTKHGHDLTVKEQIAACDDHRFIPSLLAYAEPIDADDQAVTYRHRGNGAEFKNGVGGWKSVDLSAMHEAFVTSDFVRELLHEFEGSSVVEVTS